jgi:cytochrome c oxidase subunit 2
MISFYKISTNDASFPGQFGFQDPATPIVEGMQSFHSYLFFFSIVIALFVFFMLYVVIFYFNRQTNVTAGKFTHSSSLEIVWTIFPAVILVLIALPSFALLYSLDDIAYPYLTLKVIGHQWYWSYEFSDFSELAEGSESLNFDSYMLNFDDLTHGSFRLLEVDNRVVLPSKVHIRVLVTSSDVLHSWAIPSFGIKVDACPGRLSEVSLYIKRDGVYYGQCSELCGVNHGFMPIVIRATNLNLFVKWLAAKIPNFLLND